MKRYLRKYKKFYLELPVAKVVLNFMDQMQSRRPLKRSCLKTDVRKEGEVAMIGIQCMSSFFFQGTFTVKLYQRCFLFLNLQNTYF